VIAATRMPERSTASVDVGLARLRMKLGEVEPALVARSQEPVVATFMELYRQAVAAGRILDRGEQQAVYLIMALKGASIISRTLGNEYGLDLPDHPDLARFCMQGLGVDADDAWYTKVSDQVRLPPGPASSRSTRGRSAAAGAEVARSV
jgi:hypothetical protein